MPRFLLPLANPSRAGLMSGPDKKVVNQYNPQVVAAAPATGATVAFPNDYKNNKLLIQPAGTLAALTIALPSDANSVLNQCVSFTTTQIVTALTMTVAAGSAPTLIGAPTALTAGATWEVTKLASSAGVSTWGFK